MNTAWTAQRFGESLRKGEISPLYFLFGEETYLIDEALVSLEKAILSEGMRDFNLNVFYGDNADCSKIRDAVETLPMMCAKRVVILKAADELTDKEWEQLQALVDNPVDSTTFICVATKVDKRKKYIKRFLENGVVVEFKRPFDNQIVDWVRNIGQKHGLKISQASASLIQDLVGNNLLDLDSEIRKLALFLGERKTPTETDITSVVSHVRIDTVFDLTEAIGSNDRSRALICLAQLLDQGQNEVGILALVTRHVRILKLIQDGLSEGLSGTRLSSRAGVPPFFLKQYIEQAESWDLRKIENTFKALLDTDRALKSSPIASHIWLENFILQTCSH